MPPSKAPALHRATKRPRTDGTLSSPHIIDSDSDNDVQLAAVQTKRRRPSGVQQTPAQPPVQIAEKSTDDSGPLIMRMKRGMSGVSKSVSVSSRDGFVVSGRIARSSPHVPIAPAAPLPSRGLLSAPPGPPDDSRRLTSGFGSPQLALAPAKTPPLFSSSLQKSFLLYGEQTNLKSAFQSVSSASRAKPPAFTTHLSPRAAAYSSLVAPTHTGTGYNPFTSHLSPPGTRSANQLPYPSPACSLTIQSRLAAISRRPGDLENPFTPPAPFTLRRQVPSPDRLFTNLSLENVNELTLSMPRVEAEIKRRGAKNAEDTASLRRGSVQKAVRTKNLGGFKRIATKTSGGDEIVEELGGFEMGEAEEDFRANVEAGSDDTEGKVDEDGLHLVDAHITRHRVGDNTGDNSFSGVDEHAGQVSPAAAKQLRIDYNVTQTLQRRKNTKSSSLLAAGSPVPRKRFMRQSLLDCATPSARAASIVDLTEGESLAAQPLQEKSLEARFIKAIPLATDPLSQLPTTSATTERPEITKKREKEFLNAFNQRWWLGGYSIHTAIIEVSATMHPSTTKFSQEEGELRLRALATQDKLAIRHNQVYHLDQDPGANAPPPPPVKKDGLTQVQRFEQHLTELNNNPEPSPYGKISTARFKLFQDQLYSQVFTKQLFANERSEETLGQCLVGLNLYLDERKKLGVKEVSAAFVHLSKKGDVVLEGDMIRFTEQGLN